MVRGPPRSRRLTATWSRGAACRRPACRV